MKILLTAVNAKYIHSNPAVYSLKAAAETADSSVQLAEFTINQSKDEILKGIFRRKPEVLCFSCYIWNISLVEELAEEMSKLLPDTRIWMGGPEVSYDAQAVLKRNPEITGVMKGEGEGTFRELVRFYETGEPRLDQIAGITWRETDGTIRENPWRPVMSMDEIPFIYHRLEDFENRILYYESSRGCPFSCSYCLSSLDKRPRYRDLELVKKELQFFLDHKVPQVKFVDRTFNCSHGRTEEIWRYLTEHDNGITNFHFEIAADLLTEKELDLISRMRPGMIQLEIGVQSANPETLREIRRKTNLENIRKTVETLRSFENVHLHLDLIAGLPYEDYESFGNSFNQVYQMKPHQLQLGFLKLLKGSYMQESANRYGCVSHGKEPYEVLYTRWLSYEDILKLKQVEEMVEVYYNSGQFSRTLQAVVPFFASPFAFFQRLGEFYDRHGYLDISHNRIRRYEILKEFLTTYPAEEKQNRETEEWIRELMVLDLYARENLKTRPSWAVDPGVYGKRERAFFQREAKEHRYLDAYQGYEEKQLMRMTHLEHVRHDPRTGKECQRYLLFDYQKRDPLTSDAFCMDVTEAVTQGEGGHMNCRREGKEPEDDETNG